MPEETGRRSDTERGIDGRRREIMILGAAAALGSGLGATGATASLDGGKDEHDEATGLFLAAITGDQQSDSVETIATGGAVFSMNEDGSELEYALLVNAIDDANQAHIHLGQVGEEGPVVVWLYPGSDADEPELQEGRFDGILATGTITEDHLTGDLEGQSLEALVDEIDDENAYVNVHTEEYPAGEIRGQLVRVEDVAAALLDEDRIGDDVERDDAEPVEDDEEPDMDDDDEADVDDDDEPEEDDEPDVDDEEPDEDVDDPDEVFTFLDCHTVRIVGDFPEAVLYGIELLETDQGEVVPGAMGSFPMGPVDGERTIDIEEELFEGVIISAAVVLDGPFSEGTPVHERIHPERDQCIIQLFEDAGLEPPNLTEVPDSDDDEAENESDTGEDTDT
ncbi:CHRD domain-containing protein [Natrialbaceae archaeon A-CW3]